MGIFTSAVGTLAAIVAGGAFIRHRISRSWISAGSIDAKLLNNNEVCVITGGNSGLGLETARDLARRGGTIVLACRDCISGEAAASSIRKSTGNDRVQCLTLDLSSLNSVKKFSHELIQNHESIYALICNAAVWMPMNKRQKTEDGFEIHFGVNHLGHFDLIHTLVPHMKKSGKESRIILVSSSLSKAGKIDMNNRDFISEGRKSVPNKSINFAPASFAPTGYCDSKLMNILTCRELAKELKGSNISTYSVCPGFCRTQLDRHVEVPFFKSLLTVPMMRLMQRNPLQGAQNIVFATVEDRDKLLSGAVYKDGKIAEKETKYVDGLGEILQKQLWDLSKKILEGKDTSAPGSKL